MKRIAIALHHSGTSERQDMLRLAGAAALMLAAAASGIALLTMLTFR
ncbi:hypothetical protein [Bosea sp. (in: a-proteobacteria)]